MATTETSPFRFAWKLKMGIVIGLLVAVAGWFLLDAALLYPKRGEKAARWAERDYLVQAAGGADRPYRIHPESVSVADPQGEFERLRARAAAQGAMSPLEQDRLVWLRALSYIDRLDPQHTTYAPEALGEPNERLAEIDAAFASSTSPPKPLNRYDIASQWIIFVGLSAITLAMLVFVAVVSRRRAHWEPEARALTLPGGQTITPEDIVEIDKRKWDKYYVFLKIRPEHPTLGDKTLKVDLYRRERVEEWVLEMERIRFPELVAQEEAERAAAEDEALEAADAAGEKSPA